jgi:hypothetical protein
MEKLQPKGHLEIWKIYEDGTEELHFTENNVITSGMGVGLSHLFGGVGAKNFSDYQILNFSVGSGGDVDDYGVSTFALTTPKLPHEYRTAGSELIVENLYTIGNNADSPHAEITSASSCLVRIPYSNIQKVTATSVRFNLTIDANSLVNQTINEVGLFMRNPRGNTPHPNPILVAYRPFTALSKVNTFALLLKWTLSF